MSAKNLHSHQRMVENEAIFREHNEMLERQLAELNKLAGQTGHEGYDNDDKLVLQFYCECSDENCRERVTMSVMKYRSIHKNRKRFIVVPGHDVAGLERIVEQAGEYTTVEKFIDAPEDPKTLHTTTIQNV